MNDEKLTETAEMGRRKEEAPGLVAASRGQSDTRHINNTPSLPRLQGENNGPAQPSAVQRARLLAMLRRAPLDTLQARAMGVMSPAARIFELKKAGFEIITTRLPNRVGVYHLLGEAGHGDE